MIPIKIDRGWHACALLCAIAVLLLIPRLGSFGLWEPYELDVLETSVNASSTAGDSVSRWMTTLAVQHGGLTSWWARISSVFFALLALLLCFAWIARATTKRTALVASLLLLCAPLFLLQARLAVNALPTVVAHLLVFLGLAEVLFGERRMQFVGALLVILGGVLGGLAAGWPLGVFLPCAVSAIAAGIHKRWWFMASMVALGAVSLLVMPNALQPITGQWHSMAKHQSWDIMLEPIAFGAFPWIVLAPVALLSAPNGGSRKRFMTHIASSWVVLSFVLATVIRLHVGPAVFLAMPGLAYLVAAWLLDPKARAGQRLHQSLLFALVLVMLGHDLRAFSDHLPAIHLSVPSLQNGVSSSAHQFVFLGIALVSGVLIFLRHTKRVPLASSIVLLCITSAAFLSLVWMPSLSRSLSHEKLVSTYLQLRTPGDTIVTIGRPPKLLALRDPSAVPSTQQALLGQLQASPRVFAMVANNSYCQVRQSAHAAGVPIEPLVKDSTHMLVSNRRGPGEPSAQSLDSRLTHPEHLPPANNTMQVFGDVLKLRSIDLPDRVREGSHFTLRMRFEVLKRPRRKWKIFAHFDGPGVRFQADHWPIDDLCPSNYWNVGDIVVDTVRVHAASRKGRYRLWTGFFYGSNGNWTRMPASGDGAEDNRVEAGEIEIY